MHGSVQGECRYEQELLPYLNVDGHVNSRQIDKKKKKKSPKGTKTCTKTASNKTKPSHTSFSDLECIDEEDTRGTGLISVLTKQKPPVEHESEKLHDDIRDHVICPLQSNNDCPGADVDDDCAIVNEDVTKAEHTVRETVDLDNISQLITKTDGREPDLEDDVELQAMFYLPKWDLMPPSSAKLFQGRDESLKAILANVAELLSRSPPLLDVDLDAAMAAPSPPPSPQRVQGLHQPFQVSFTLDVDDNDDDDDEVMVIDADNADGRSVEKEDNTSYHNWQPVRAAADSPTWDEVFDDEEENQNHDGIEINDKMFTGVMEVQAGEEVEKSEGIQSKNGEEYWDDVRDEEMPDLKPDRDSQMDESMDLFGDEAFLQMTIPEIPTPEDAVTPRTSPAAEDIAKSTKKMSNTSDTHTMTNPCSTTDSADVRVCRDTITHNTTETEHNTHTAAPSKHATHKAITSLCKSPTIQQNGESFDKSHDYFPVNFDLGYSLEDSEEEEEVEAVPAPCMETSPQPKKQAYSTVSLPGVSNSSTPYNSFHRPVRSSESRLYTPQSLSEHRRREKSSLLISPLMSKGGALPSPITSPAARRMLMSGPAGPRTPSSLSILKRRQPEGRTTKAETGPGIENLSRQEFVYVSDFALYSGLLFFFLKLTFC